MLTGVVYTGNMKIKSVSGLGFYVQDIARTADFYQMLGFRMGERTETTCKVYMNWFWMQFTAISAEDKPEFQKEAQAEPKGGGLYINLAVDGIDDLYADLLARGVQPSSEPRDWPSGSREFVLRDPDGYKLVFFEKH
jgi:catechol 2,3-dioxygenase-like lactoylglutathione lyase family enzyme